MIVSVCPAPAKRGMSANLTVVPSFSSVAGEPIENIESHRDFDQMSVSGVASPATNENASKSMV